MKAIFIILAIAASTAFVESFLLSYIKGIFKAKDQTIGISSSCSKRSIYRSVDGSCNNLKRPKAGTAGLPYSRLGEATYSDGKGALPTAKSGNPLPNSREISYTLHPEEDINDNIYTINTQQFGQLITHDMSMASGLTQKEKCPVSRCHLDNIIPSAISDRTCAFIAIPEHDPVYTTNETICLQVIRTKATKDEKCHSSECAIQPISDVTPWLDLSQVYGSTLEGSNDIREFKRGRLKGETRHEQTWPPHDSQTCTRQSRDDPCYKAGDTRVNQNPQLTVLQIIFFREHNRLCNQLNQLNPHWNDERLFQEARRILIAAYQHIVYYTYVPIIVGYDKAVSQKLIYKDQVGYVNTYDDDIDPSLMVEFATAAFRMPHTNVNGEIRFYKEDREARGDIYLRNYYNTPGFLEEQSNFDDLARSLTTQSMRASDQYYDLDVTIYLFKGSEKLGNDLRAVDIQRGRDHGLPFYVDVRKICGLPVPKNFTDLLDYGISKENVDKLEELYESVEDLELTVVGVLEPPEKDAQCGATFQSLISLQFLRSRVSDRFFYEDGTDREVALSLDQLNAIRAGASLSRIFCDNVESIKSMQPNAFVQISESNKLMPCDKLPSIDLKFWKEGR